MHTTGSVERSEVVIFVIMAFQGDSIYWVEVEKIVPNPYQPRREFDEGRLKELAESVRMYGVLQPLTVTRKEVHRPDGTFFTEYELIAGERRLRASKLAGLIQVPVIIRDGEQSEQEKLELAIIENLQREDLNAVDRAIAFKQLADQFNLSHAQVAKKVGRSREYVSNTLRLLQLPEYILTSLKGGDISEGHGRTLLMLTDRPEEQDTLYREILLKKLSVREVERIARKIATDKVRKKDWGIDPVLMDIEKRFTDSLGTRVSIQQTDYGGKLTIDYFTSDDLEQLLQLIEQQKQAGGQVDTTTAERLQELVERTPLTVVTDSAPEIPPTSAAQSIETTVAERTESPTQPETSSVVTHHDLPIQQETSPTHAEATADEWHDTTYQDRMLRTWDEPVQTTPEESAVSYGESAFATHTPEQNHDFSPTATPQVLPMQPTITPPTPTAPQPVTPPPAPSFGSFANPAVSHMADVQQPMPARTVVQPPVASPKPSPEQNDEDTDLYDVRNFTV